MKRVKPGLEQLFRKGKQIYATDRLNTITNTCVNTIFASTVNRKKKSGTHAISKIGHLNIYSRNRPTRLSNALPLNLFIFKGYELLLNNLNHTHKHIYDLDEGSDWTDAYNMSIFHLGNCVTAPLKQKNYHSHRLH